MKPAIHHRWDLNEKEAIAVQQQLAKQVVPQDRLAPVEYVAGVDVAYGESGDELVAAVVILDANTLQLVEAAVVRDTVQFPYIPGLFSFREIPPVIKAFAKLEHVPQLLICDGQGMAHPRRFGLACHLGVLYDLPAIGCGKTRLLGDYAEPGSSRGSFSPLTDQGETIGSALRTQTAVKPVFVSVGHRISLQTACSWIIRLAPKYRLPETTRQADQLVRKHSSST